VVGGELAVVVKPKENRGVFAVGACANKFTQHIALPEAERALRVAEMPVGERRSAAQAGPWRPDTIAASTRNERRTPSVFVPDPLKARADIIETGMFRRLFFVICRVVVPPFFQRNRNLGHFVQSLIELIRSHP
jgi:hypothetical protein